MCTEQEYSYFMVNCALVKARKEIRKAFRYGKAGIIEKKEAEETTAYWNQIADRLKEEKKKFKDVKDIRSAMKQDAQDEE